MQEDNSYDHRGQAVCYKTLKMLSNAILEHMISKILLGSMPLDPSSNTMLFMLTTELLYVCISLARLSIPSGNLMINILIPSEVLSLTTLICFLRA